MVGHHAELLFDALEQGLGEAAGASSMVAGVGMRDMGISCWGWCGGGVPGASSVPKLVSSRKTAVECHYRESFLSK